MPRSRGLGRGVTGRRPKPQAERYVFMQDAAGAAIYVVDLPDPVPDLLDLRSDPWSELLSATGIDEARYGERLLGHSLIQKLIPDLVAQGYEWVAHPVFGHVRSDWGCPPDEWLYLGDVAVPASLDRTVPVTP